VRLKHVENWYLLVQSGVAHVGSSERLLIVDEAPREARTEVLYGRSGKMFAELFGYTDREELLEHVDAINLLPRWPGRSSSGNVLFPMRSARRQKEKLQLDAGGFVLLGRVGKVYGFGYRVLVGSPRTMLLPCSRDKWWNKENTAQAQKALEPWATFTRTGRWPR
jgi:hypothetical protein